MAVLSLGTAKASELKNLKRNADGTYYYDYLLDEDEREINTGNAAADNWLSTRRSSVKRDDAPEDAKKRIEIWSDVVKEQKQQLEKLEKKVVELEDNELLYIDAEVTREYVNAATLLNLELRRYEGGQRRLEELGINYQEAYAAALERDREELTRSFSTPEPASPEEIELETEEGRVEYLRLWEELQQQKKKRADMSDAVAEYAMQQGLAEAGQGAAAMEMSDELTDTLYEIYENPAIEGDILDLAGAMFGSYAASYLETAGDVMQGVGTLYDAVMMEPEEEKKKFYEEIEAITSQLNGLEAEKTAAISQALQLGAMEEEIAGLNGQYEEKRRELEDRLEQLQSEYELNTKDYTFGLYDLADRLQEDSAERMAKVQEDMSGFGKFLTNMLMAVGQMAGDVALGVVTGTGTLAISGLRNYGSQSQRARQSGASWGEAVASGVLSTFAGTLVEKITGIGLGQLTGVSGGLDDVINRGIEKAASRFIKDVGGQQAFKNVMGVIAGTLGEGFEGALDSLMEPIAESIYDSKALERYTDPEQREGLIEDTVYNIMTQGVIALFASSVQQIGGYGQVDRGGETGYTGSNWENSVDIDAAARDFNADLILGGDASADIKNLYKRPSHYRKGLREQVWENAKNAEGKVIDPLTGKEMNFNEPWDMGHLPGYEFRKHQQSAMKRGITRKQFLDEYNNPEHYRPELPSSNRSHRGEDGSNNYYGP